MVNLQNKIALVTGASRGIGRSIAVKLAENGVKLAINSSSNEGLKLIKNELERYGVDAFTCPGNLADPETPKKIIGSVANHFGGIDILINNAGVAISKPLIETSAEEWDNHMNINARAPFLLCREAIPYLKKSDCAAIINISSVVGYKGYVNQGAYGASKHALVGMTKVLAQEVYKDNIRVHIIAPGGVATDMISKMRPDIDKDELVSAQEIADVALFLLTRRGNGVIDEINIHRASSGPWK